MNQIFEKACENLQNMDIQFRVDNLCIKVDFIRIEEFKPEMRFDDHSHSNLEFHYIKSGYGNVVMDGTMFELDPGCMYVTGSGLVHSQQASKEDPMLEYAMKCSLMLENKPIPGDALSEEEYIFQLFENNPSHVAKDQAGIDRSFEALFMEAYEMQPGFLGQLKSLVLRIIFSFARALDVELSVKRKVPYRDLSNFRMDLIRRYIADNLSRSIKCGELSRHIFLSEKQLSRIIKEKTNLSIHEFILGEKIKTIKQLLQNKNLTLREIADKTGFSSEFHLSRTFKGKVGISPEVYRKKVLSEDSGNTFYPLTFKTLYKDYIWGGRNLVKLGKALPENSVAESWEISAHHHGMNIIADGPFAGLPLEDLVLEFGKDFLGTLSYERYKKKFPLLLKLIDVNDSFSVQVHPDDEYAKVNENDMGKTEMWYIVHAEPGASITYGLKSQMTKLEFEAEIKAGRIGECLKSYSVASGDVIFIPAGTVHAAGKGILIAEIQQNSNATYRLYDYGRKNVDGTSRPLHIKKALDSIRFDKASASGKYSGLSYLKDGMRIRAVVADSHFFSEIIEVEEHANLKADGRSFIAFIILEGTAVISWDKGSMEVQAGHSVLLPANLGSFSIKGPIKALKAYVGDREEDIIKPLMDAGYEKDQIFSSIGGIEL